MAPLHVHQLGRRCSEINDLVKGLSQTVVFCTGYKRQHDVWQLDIVQAFMLIKFVRLTWKVEFKSNMQRTDVRGFTCLPYILWQNSLINLKKIIILMMHLTPLGHQNGAHLECLEWRIFTQLTSNFFKLEAHYFLKWVTKISNMCTVSKT